LAKAFFKHAQSGNVEIDRAAETQDRDGKFADRAAQPARRQVEIAGDLVERAVGGVHKHPPIESLQRYKPQKSWGFREFESLQASGFFEPM
jgi:hypothetical protein